MSRPKISKDYQDGYDLGYKKGYVDGAKDFQPKKGKWTYIGISEVTGLKIYKCNVCNKRTYGSQNFCPNCGADMRKEKQNADKT